MEITEQQFTANLEQMPEEAQAQVVQIIEANEPPALQAFAMSLGVTLSLSEEEAPMAEDPMAEALMPEDPMAEAPVPEAPMPEEAASPMQDQMQQLALGDQVAGMIDQPGAEDQTGVADDVPMNAREGAFIVNAAAIAKVGKKDFEERIIEPAIKYLEEKEGIVIDKATITRPAQQVKGGQKILASNKEYHIPPELVEVIGSDLLEKINKRGEAGTEKQLAQQEEQQQAAPPGQGQVPVRAANGLQVGKKKVKPSLEQIQKNQEQVYNKLKSEGLREEAAAGIMGNIHAENDTFEYQRIEDNSKKQKGYGIFQFTGGRRKAYENYLNAMGKTDSLDAQVEYTLDTINIVPDKANAKFPKWETNDLGYDNRKKLRGVLKTGTAEQVANVFLDRFERPKDPEATRKKRVDFANKIFSSAKTLFSTPAQQTQNSFMGSAPPIGSPEDERENRIAREQLEAATR